MAVFGPVVFGIAMLLAIVSTGVVVLIVASGGTDGNDASTKTNGIVYCSSITSDVDGDGWGWENNALCVVEGGSQDPVRTGASSSTPVPTKTIASSGESTPAPSSTSVLTRTPAPKTTATGATKTSDGYPYCVNAASDPDGDGWGWENSASCVVRGSAADHGPAA